MNTEKVFTVTFTKYIRSTQLKVYLMTYTGRLWLNNLYIRVAGCRPRPHESASIELEGFAGGGRSVCRRLINISSVVVHSWRYLNANQTAHYLPSPTLRSLQRRRNVAKLNVANPSVNQTVPTHFTSVSDYHQKNVEPLKPWVC